jgi:hypothetical protein
MPLKEDVFIYNTKVVTVDIVVYARDIIIVKSTKNELNQLLVQLCTKFHVRILAPSTSNKGLFSRPQVNPTL